MVWESFLSLPSRSLPQRVAKPVKRLTALAHELAVDGLLADTREAIASAASASQLYEGSFGKSY